MFLSNLAFLLLSITSGEFYAVNPLNLHSLRCLLIVDSGNGTPRYFRVLCILIDVVKGFFVFFLQQP